MFSRILEALSCIMKYKYALVIIIAILSIFIANILYKQKEVEASVVFLGDGSFYPSLLKDIANSSKSVICAMYMFKTKDDINTTSSIANAMIDAVRKGVEVKIVLEHSARADLANEYNYYTADLLRRGGVVVYFDKPDRKLHAKMCVIDSALLYLGSHNYTYSGMKRNSEASIKVISPAVAMDATEYILSKID